MLLDAVLNGFAILSTIVATLRAGSRASYISQHGAIDLVDGPRIAPPPTTTSTVAALLGGEHEIESAFNVNATESTTSSDPYNPALYELAENFKKCVKISSSDATTATEESLSSSHGCENLFRNRPISTLVPPLTSEGAPPPPQTKSKSKDRSTPKTSSTRRFRKLWKQVRSFAGEQMQKQQTKKDPFEEKTYTLGYAHYAPRTFRGNEIENDIEPNQASSLGDSFTKIPLGPPPRSTHYNSFDKGPVDFGRATEADYYYHAISTTPDLITKRRRLAQLKAYCPKVFGDLRSAIFGISEEDYLQSMLGSMVSFQSNSKGAARSGGIFFFTSDGAYMIKTIPDRERKTLLTILPDYHAHMKRYGRSSLLTRFCGMYGITIEEEDEATTINIDSDESESGKFLDPAKDILGAPSDAEGESSASSFAPTGKEYTFVVMNAVFPAEANTFIAERFDLKGSTVGREVSREELESKGSMAVLKDLDLSKEVDLVRAKQKEQQQREDEERWFHQSRNSKRWWGRRRLQNSFDIKRRRSKNKDHSGFTIGATAKAALLSQLRMDVQFLTKCQVMDYSLLVGVVHADGGVGSRNSAGAAAPDGNGLTHEIVETIRKQKKVLESLEGPSPTKTHHRLRKRDSALLYTLTTPVRLMLSPPQYVARTAWNVVRRTLDSIVTAPMPYYGSGLTKVDGGELSVMHGTRKGGRAIYYMGLIDFLQPWTTRKVMERKFKGVLGYDTDAISAVTPEEYAVRFLEFLDQHIH